MMRYINKTDLLIVATNFGKIMIGVGVLCLVPIIVDLIYFEFNLLGFIIPSVISIGLGLLCNYLLRNYSHKRMHIKHGMIISAMAWLWAALVCGSAMFLITHHSFIDVTFESMSALTGSGVTLFPNVEILPHSILFFRAFQQWVGGLGIIVMIIAILTRPGTASSRLYKSEAREEKLKPSVKNTLEHTIKIYLIYTCLGIGMYLLAGMPLFDSICNTFTTISTGGMSIKNANIGYYHNDLIYFVTIIIMILGATSFLVHYKVIKTKGRSLIEDLQFKVMISVIAIVTVLLYFVSNIVPMELLFTVISAITTTGASVQSSAELAGYPSFVIICIMALMLVGGSNGSTVGAIKLNRVIIFFKGIYKHIREIMSPSGRVVPVKLSNAKVSEKAISDSGNYITLYLICIMITWGLFCFYGYDPFNSLFDAISLQGNVGFSAGAISPTMELPLKIVGIFNMWTGRLEIYPVLIALRAMFEIFKR